MGVLHKRILEGNADAVEFCPTPAYQNFLAAASYTLIEGPTPTRVGAVYLFSLDDENLKELQTMETSGVFDIKWRKPCPQGLAPCLGQASADGSLRLYTLQHDDKPALIEIATTSATTSMCLSLDWNPSHPEVAVSDSSGALTTIDVGQSSLQSTTSCQAHELEVWTTSYDTHHPSVLYTGADDCHFCSWDTRQGLDSPVFRNTRSHTMGVCSVQKHPQSEHCLITGSYDEKLRVWDVRVPIRPVVSVAVGLGGGVWRLKWHPVEMGLVLAACMHRGVVVVRVSGDANVEVVDVYEEHESLAYGVDWFQGEWKTGEKRKAVAASCSFYDKSMHLWEPDGVVLASEKGGCS